MLKIGVKGKKKVLIVVCNVNKIFKLTFFYLERDKNVMISVGATANCWDSLFDTKTILKWRA